MTYDVLIVGGGPAGLSAALALGRARKKVLLCDAGPRRNARAENIHNFITRDGTPPDDFRRFGRGEIGRYPSIEIRDEQVLAISGQRSTFSASLETGPIQARRVLLATGMIDKMLPVEGFSELWGHSIFQCPYCHGWENQDRAWAYLAREENLGHLVPFAVQLRAWTRDVTIVPYGSLTIPETIRNELQAVGVPIKAAALTQLVASGSRLTALRLSDGEQLACDALFAHPPQEQVELVRKLGLALDENGFLALDPMRRETSIPGIYAAGDLAARMQGAILGAAAGTHAATAINAELTMELARDGLI